VSEKMTTSEPSTGEIVRKLETLLPPMTNYAESVCAEGAFAHSTYMVWDDPEPYIIKNGIDRLKSQEQTIAALTARAEQAEAREKAAIADMKLIADNVRETHCDETCCFACKHDCDTSINDSGEYNSECPGFYRDDCFEWRGARKGERND
jgi:hypothetical protein